MPAHERISEIVVELEILSRDSSARFLAPSKQQSRQRGTVLGIFELGNRIHSKLLRAKNISRPGFAPPLLFENVPGSTPVASQIRNNKKILFRECVRHDKISACDNITICSGSCLRTVVTAPIAQAQERCRCLVHRDDSICAPTGRGSRYSQRKSCTSNRLSTSCFGSCAVTPTLAT